MTVIGSGCRAHSDSLIPHYPSMLHESCFISEKAHVPFGTGLFAVSIMVNGLGPFVADGRISAFPKGE